MSCGILVSGIGGITQAHYQNNYFFNGTAGPGGAGGHSSGNSGSAGTAGAMQHIDIR
jgi:hypothetical protein